MAYDQSLARRVRHSLSSQRQVVEKKLFGGIGFMVRGNLCAAVWKNSLILRLGAEAAAEAMEEPHVGPFDVTGKPMRGWVLVELDGLDSDAQLTRWIDLALAFVATLPTK